MQWIKDRLDTWTKDRFDERAKDGYYSHLKIEPLKILAPLLKKPAHFVWVREVFNDKKDISFLMDPYAISKITECEIKNLTFIQKNFSSEITPEIFTDKENYNVAHALRYSEPANLIFLKERFPSTLTLKMLEDQRIRNILADTKSL